VYDEVTGKFGEWNKNILGSYLTTKIPLKMFVIM